MDFQLPVLPQLVSLLDSDSDCGELDMSALDKTVHPEDFSDAFW